ncbi:MAG: glycosyltransferase [Bryobacteraceae bacterium]
MRIGVLRTQVPFVTGGAERHAANLCHALNRHGHEAVEITLPFKWYPGEVLASHILAAKMLDLSEVEGVAVDMVIGLKFPAYLAPHANKTFWIIHQHRQAYDMWSLGNSDLLRDPDGEALRQLIWEEDRAAFSATAHPIFTNSRNVSARLKKYLGFDSIPIYHPPPQADRMIQGRYGDYIFAPGRINPSKRLELILRGLAKARSKVRLVVAGVAENPAYQEQLLKLAAELGVSSRVEWLGRVDDAKLLRTYADARAVVFTPQDEDYGYVTLEAMLAGKPVITVEDAGGPLEFIVHEQHGLVVPPVPAELGRAYERVMQDRDAAERWGQAGAARYAEMNIGWDQVVERLVGGFGSVAAAARPIAPEPQEPIVAQPTGTERLAAAVAPPDPPAGFAFRSVAEIFEAYQFDGLPRWTGGAGPAVSQDLANYLGTHWTRYLTTIDAIGQEAPKKTLDVGVFPPLIFQAMLASRYPGVEMAGLWEGPDRYCQEARGRAANFPDFNVTLSTANTERDRWPYEDESFDLVTGMEILEHLAVDPYFLYTEAARILKPGGRILLTTPNIVSHHGFWKVLNGFPPYSFGAFVPNGGVYGRHNREYAPSELTELGQAAGFVTLRLATFDVYNRNIDAAVAAILVERGDDLTLRGETIFYLARKTGIAGPAPQRLYHGDPRPMSGAFHQGRWDDDTGLLRLGLENRSPVPWTGSGLYATCVAAQWIDAGGVLRRQHLFQPIANIVKPGETCEFVLRLDPLETRSGRGHLRLHAFQVGVGVFTGTGRCPPLLLPCSEEAFLRLVETQPPVAARP